MRTQLGRDGPGGPAEAEPRSHLGSCPFSVWNKSAHSQIINGNQVLGCVSKGSLREEILLCSALRIKTVKIIAPLIYLKKESRTSSKLPVFTGITLGASSQ